MKKEFILLVLITLLMAVASNAQTVEKKWGFGADIGGYYNMDMNAAGMTPGAYLSRYLSPSFDLMADVTIGYFGNRSLTEPLDFLNPTLKLRYKLYNNKIMPAKSKLQPYLYAGGGYLFDNAESGPNFNAGLGFKFPMNKTFSLFAEGGYIHGIDSERAISSDERRNVHDNFIKLVVGIEISFIKQPDTDKDGVIDNLDECPGTPKGATVDSKGCPSDSDGDGVLDGIDKCPNTPKGAPVDEKGCPLDSDDDGVIDLYDECPDTPKKVKVDEKGCPFDADGDGVYDENDKCPDTPQGTEVDEDGCPIDKDSDGDGVMDSVDECPDTPKSAVVDKKGCVDPQATIDFLNPQLKPVYFDTNVHTVTQNQYNIVDNLVNLLNDYPEFKINIYGHADPRGTEEYNRALSSRRAQAVVELLIERGIPEERIETKAFGEEMAPTGELSEEELQEERKAASYMFISLNEE